MISIQQIRNDIRSLRYELTPSAVAEILDTLGATFSEGYADEHEAAICCLSLASEMLDCRSPESVSDDALHFAEMRASDERREGEQQ